MTDPEGTPLAVLLSRANDHDINFIAPLVYLSLPVIGGKPGRPLQFSRVVRADCGYTSQPVLSLLEHSNIQAFIPQRGQPTARGLGKKRWPVERTISWLKQMRRVGIRRERRLVNYQAFVSLACSIICFRKLDS